MQRCWRYVEFWRLRRRASSHLIHRKMRERIRGLLKSDKKNPFEVKEKQQTEKKNCRTYNSVKQMKFAKKNPLVAVQKTIFGYECKTNKKKISSSPLMWDWMFNVFLWFNTGHIMQFELLRYIEQLMRARLKRARLARTR